MEQDKMPTDTKIPPVRKEGETEEDYAKRVANEIARQEEEADAAKALAAAEAQALEEAKKRANNAPKIERNFAKTKTLMHDLFKLKVAVCKKNISYQKDSLDMVKMEHVHFFHSIDSHGFPQKTCNPVAGHTHEITIKLDAKGEIERVVCGASKKQIEITRAKGVIKKELVPISFGVNSQGETEVDVHTHEIEYVRSEKIEVVA